MATTVNAFGAAANLTMGATTGTATIRNANTVVVGDLAVNGGDLTSTASTFNLLNDNTTVNAFTATTNLTLGATTGTATIRNANTVVTGDLAVNGGDQTSTASTFNLLNGSTTVNAFTSSTATLIGAATGTTTIGNNLSMRGNTLTLNSDGTGTENINIVVERGATDATITWDEAADAWVFTNEITVDTLNTTSVIAEQLTMNPSSGTAGVETSVLNVPITGDALVTVDSWSATNYRTAKYTVSMTKGTDYHSMDIMIIHQGGTAYMNVYSEMFTNASLGTFSVDISSGSVRLRIDPVTTGDLNILLERKLFEPY